MKIYQCIKVSLLIVGLQMCGRVEIYADEVAKDSIYQTASLNPFQDDTHRLGVREVIIPTTIVTTSALFVKNSWLIKHRRNVQNVLSAKGKYKLKMDDYIQYAPMASVYGLNLLGIKGKHNFKDRTILLGMSYLTMCLAVNTFKYTFKEKRPDSNACNSFISGHTATAFMGAEFLRKEYADVSPWIGYAGYAIAATTGYLRIYNNRHFVNDVIAGACIGMMSVKLSYWLYPKIFKHSSCCKTSFVGMPYYSTEGVGVNFAMTF